MVKVLVYFSMILVNRIYFLLRKAKLDVGTTSMNFELASECQCQRPE
jgi:hypothetical protein